MRICKVEGCGQKVHAYGHCHRHYNQVKRYGKILKRTIYDKNVIYKEGNCYRMELYNKKCEVIAETFFDGENLDRIKQYKWYKSKRYVATKYKGKQLNLSNFVMNDFEHKYMFDHIDRQPLNNLILNLRIVSISQNQINKSLQSNNTTGFVGISWIKANSKYLARIKVNRKSIHLGFFNNIQDAISARRKAEIIYHGEYSPNFQKEVCNAELRSKRSSG